MAMPTVDMCVLFQLLLSTITVLFACQLSGTRTPTMGQPAVRAAPSDNARKLHDTNKQQKNSSENATVLDEPFSALDGELRRHLRKWLKRYLQATDKAVCEHIKLRILIPRHSINFVLFFSFSPF